MNRRDIAICTAAASAVAVTTGVVALMARAEDRARLPTIVADEGGPTRVCDEWRAFEHAAGSEAGASAVITMVVSHYPSAYTDDQLADYVAWMIDNC